MTRVFRLKSFFFTALSTNISINYTARAVCPSLREPIRAEWRDTNLFLSVNKKPNYYYYKKKKSVACQFTVKYKSETYCWTQKLNKENYGVDWVLLVVAKEYTLLKNNKHCAVT